MLAYGHLGNSRYFWNDAQNNLLMYLAVEFPSVLFTAHRAVLEMVGLFASAV